MSSGGPKVVVIDNYDSFVFILVQYLGELGCDLVVHRNDDLTVEELASIEPERQQLGHGETPNLILVTNHYSANCHGWLLYCPCQRTGLC